MSTYWWQCMACGDRPTWLAVCNSRSVAAFIWDELAPSGWDQGLPLRRCNATAARCTSPTGFAGAIPRGSVSSISLGLAQMVTISRCCGRPFGIRVPARVGSISNIKGAAAPGVSTSGWFWRRQNLHACSVRMNAPVFCQYCGYQTARAQPTLYRQVLRKDAAL